MTTIATGQETAKDLYNSAFRPTKAFVEIKRIDSIIMSELSESEKGSEGKYRFDKSDFINMGVQILPGQPYAGKYVWRKVKYMKTAEEVNTNFLKDNETPAAVAERSAASARNFIQRIWLQNGRTGELTSQNAEQLIGCIYEADLRPKGDDGDAVIFGCTKTPISEYNKIAAMATGSSTSTVSEDDLPF